jgi:hypothetical protein
LHRKFNKREVLAAAADAAGSFAILTVTPFALTTCSADEPAPVNQRLHDAIQAWLGEEPGAARIAEVSGMRADAALASLRGQASDREILDAIATEAELRKFVNLQRVSDLRSGRTRLVAGWRLADTEIAAAVLAAN